MRMMGWVRIGVKGVGTIGMGVVPPAGWRVSLAGLAGGSGAVVGGQTGGLACAVARGARGASWGARAGARGRGVGEEGLRGGGALRGGPRGFPPAGGEGVGGGSDSGSSSTSTSRRSREQFDAVLSRLRREAVAEAGAAEVEVEGEVGVPEATKKAAKERLEEIKIARRRMALVMKIASEDKAEFDLEGEMPFWKTYGFERSMVKKVTAGGNVMRWKYTMAIGNGNGVGGFGQGKSKDPRRARVKAFLSALRSLQVVEMYQGHTIFHEVKTKFKANTILMWPLPATHGLRCGMTVRKICELLGIKSLGARIIGSRERNVLNVLTAIFKALDSCVTPEQVAEARGVRVVDVAKWEHVKHDYEVMEGDRARLMARRVELPSGFVDGGETLLDLQEEIGELRTRTAKLAEAARAAPDARSRELAHVEHEFYTERLKYCRALFDVRKEEVQRANALLARKAALRVGDDARKERHLRQSALGSKFFRPGSATGSRRWQGRG